MITPTLHARIMREVINPAINGMEQEGERYTGFLYAGLMITPMAASRCWSSIAAWATRKPRSS